MADSDIVAPFRRDILVGESKQNAANSESYFQRLAAQNNFINAKQYDTHAFLLNGRFGRAIGSTATDGIFPILFNMEIMAVTAFIRAAGTSGNTIFDITEEDINGVDQGSIFSTRPQFSSTAPANSSMIKYNPILGLTDFTGTGRTLPVFSKTQFVAGRTLRLDVDDAFVGADSAGLLIHFRPIN